MTTMPRSTTSPTDHLAATISAVKSRLNELETAFGSGDAPVGAVIEYIGSTAPTNWSILDGATITNGRFLYSNLWALLAPAYKSGNNIVKPNLGPYTVTIKIMKLR